MVPSRVRLVLVLSAILALIPVRSVLRAQSAAAPATGPAQSSSQTKPAATLAAPRDFSQDIPPHLSFVEGQVTLERDNKLEPAEANLPLLAGDRIKTREGGRVEILFADSSTLTVDQNTQLDLLSDSLVRLTGGALRLVIPRASEDLDYRVDAAGGYAEIKHAGEYRVDTGVNQQGTEDVHLKVVRGSAELVNEHGRTLVRAGQRAVANAAELPSYAVAVNSADLDDFDRWSEARRPGHTVTESAAYLPEEASTYSGVLDDNGTWSYDTSYGGTVWYPRVGYDWLPYSRGRWCDTPYYGWTWVGIDSWSWPTHHYGRWGYGSSGWYWAPGRTWSPAWVQWGATPGYVSWAPLGPDGRPLAFGTAGPSIGVPGRFLDPWQSWTVVPTNQFQHNVWVPAHVVAHNTLPPVAQNVFVAQPAAPLPSGPAVPRRNLMPLHAPTAPHDNATARPRATNAGPFEGARSAGPVRDTAPRGVVTGPPIPKPVAGESRGVMPMPDVAASSRAKAPAAPPPAPYTRPVVIRGGVIDDGATTAKTEPARAKATGDVPPASSYDPQIIRRVIEAERPGRTVAPPPAAADAPRAHAVDRGAPPSTSTPPPSGSGPQAMPASRARSSEPPPSSGTPAVKTAPPSAPPSGAPPPSRGGGASGGSGGTATGSAGSTTTTGSATGKTAPPAQGGGRVGRGGGA